MNYKRWLIEDLSELERLRFACGQLRTELETVRTEIEAIQAAEPSREREEWLLDARARWLDMSANLAATEKHVADMDRLLGGLSGEERRVVELMFVQRREKAAFALAEELQYETAQIYRIKDRALGHLAQMRYGVGWRT